jgi:hypothetical protein
VQEGGLNMQLISHLKELSNITEDISVSLYLVYVIKSNYSVKSAVQIIEEVHNLKRKHKKLGGNKIRRSVPTMFGRL